MLKQCLVITVCLQNGIFENKLIEMISNAYGQTWYMRLFDNSRCKLIREILDSTDCGYGTVFRITLYLSERDVFQKW